ncbi:MAG: hypothetical protein ACLFS1_11085 [Opitutales bacterium]
MQIYSGKNFYFCADLKADLLAGRDDLSQIKSPQVGLAYSFKSLKNREVTLYGFCMNWEKLTEKKARLRGG